jgi:hypothetical protein
MEKTVKTWILRGIKDLYLSFVLEQEYAWTPHAAFLLEQGAEKICKAYLIAKTLNNKELDYNKAKSEAHRIGKNYNHNFKKIIADINEPEINSLRKKYYDTHYKITGEKILENLEDIFIESRYPVLTEREVHKKFPIGKDLGASLDIMGSSPLRDFCYELASTIISVIKEKFDIYVDKQELYQRIKSIEITNDNYSKQRFWNVFKLS